jgi:hypothetical protein
MGHPPLCGPAAGDGMVKVLNFVPSSNIVCQFVVLPMLLRFQPALLLLCCALLLCQPAVAQIEKAPARHEGDGPFARLIVRGVTVVYTISLSYENLVLFAVRWVG